ncbi:colicin D [Neisseria sp. oral taxon 020 str. F0370]|jgi:hypothetical protein|uniref:colicin immunity domain-containing protein n=2 Tax=Neisseriales TaxID=206351 RepID=UPI0002A41135|nr:MULTISPECIES: colicin immunity domain-containing protein [Neisseriaceae]ASP16433.1 colicin D [Neisseria sp. KEM232]EKY06119.1 colicin D [Neisseria sp. oral taxon 020 str. F0370]MDD2183855.1 colicin immunity domain-containing protein [Kingella sp. SNUBH-2017]
MKKMSPLLCLATDFIDDKIDADTFVDAYMEMWRSNASDFGGGEQWDRADIAGSLYIIADRYCPLEFREDIEPWELDEHELKQAVSIFLNSKNSDEAYETWENIRNGK